MPRALLLYVTSILFVWLVACSSASAPDDAATSLQTPRDPGSLTPPATAIAPVACDAAGGAVFCADPASMETAIVLDVIDGDTFDALKDGGEERIRLYGVDTPERGDDCYREATDALRSLVGGEVRLAVDARDRDPNGRLLRYVYTPEGLSIDATLIADGLAVAWTRDGSLRDPLVALEQQARAERRGCLWD